MKGCPFCGAAIREDASFCVYCMKELNTKERLTPLASGRRKKRLRMICLILTGVLLIGAAGGTGLHLLLKEMGAKGSVSLAPDPDDPRVGIYADKNRFERSYLYPVAYDSDEDSYCWEPWELSQEQSRNGWVEYSCPSRFQNEKPRICFKLDGTAVLVILYAVRGEDAQTRMDVTDHLSRFIYVNATGEYDDQKLFEYLMAPPGAGYVPYELLPVPMSVSDYSPVERLGIGEDPYKDAGDSRRASFYRTTSFPEFGEDNRFFEFTRERYEDGEKLTDYFFYFTFGEDVIP